MSAPAQAGGAPTAPDDGSRSAAADVLFRDGRARMESGDYPHACGLFAESMRIEPSLGALFNLAACEEAVGKRVAAWEHYGQLLERMTTSDERYPIAAAHRLALDRSMAWLTVTLSPSCPPGTRITRDGIELEGPSFGLALPLDPGSHEIVVLAPGHDPRLYTFAVDRGDHRAMSVEPGVLDTRVAHDPPVVGYVMGGLGLAALTAGAVLGVRALQRQSDGDADCSGSVCRDAAGVQAYADARNLAVATDVTLGIGVGAVIAGAYLVWFAPSSTTTGIGVTPVNLGFSF
jgi:hypothetical protein